MSHSEDLYFHILFGYQSEQGDRNLRNKPFELIEAKESGVNWISTNQLFYLELAIRDDQMINILYWKYIDRPV